MASDHSYQSTIKNNRTEGEAVAFLLSADNTFIPMNKEERKHILSVLGLEKSFSRAFDLIQVRSRINDGGTLESVKLEDVTLIELKTTKKKLTNLPRGFFFGATENEYKLAAQLGDRYKFCFVSIHPESKAFVLLTLAEVEALTKTKRIQYQVNLEK